MPPAASYSSEELKCTHNVSVEPSKASCTERNATSPTRRGTSYNATRFYNASPMLAVQVINAGVSRSGYEATVMHGKVLQEASGACSAAICDLGTCSAISF